MSVNWDYAQMSKTMSEHGGPEAFVAFIKAGAFERGMSRGLGIGTLAGAAVGGVIALGVDRYRRIQARAAQAEIALLEAASGAEA